MEINFAGAYTKEQYFRAVRMVGRPSKRSMVWRFIIFVVFLGLLIAYAVFAAQEDGMTGFDSARFLRHLVTVCILGYFVASPYIKVETTATKLWSDPLVRRKLNGQVSSLGVTYEGSTETWENFAWKYLSDDMVVLVTVNRAMSLFPRNFFLDDADWRNFLKLVEQKVIVAK